MIDVNDFDSIRISLTNADQIRSWSNGEVKKPETINYRTLKPEKDGLFCERIFGPTRDWECACGKYKKRVRFKGMICERCGVEVTRSKVRRERMGHIELAAPVSHIWYFKGVPARMGYLLDLSPKSLEKVLYYASHIIVDVDEKKRKKDKDELALKLEEEIGELTEEIEISKKEIDKERAKAEKEERKANKDLIVELFEEKEKEKRSIKAELRKDADKHPKTKKERMGDLDKQHESRTAKEEAALEKRISKMKGDMEKEKKLVEEQTHSQIEWVRELYDEFLDLEPKQLIDEEQKFRDMRERYGEYFSWGMGAETVRSLLLNIELEKEADSLREVIQTSKGQKRNKATKRLKVVAAFQNTDNKPDSMIMEVIPVIPPDLRPMVQLDGGRFATSDLNDLYRRVINRNNRLKRLLDLGAPEIIVSNEKRMLQEAVDALFDNGRRGRPVTGPGNRPLKSLSDMLKGKQGRFRQNLLGKRVDYSGRSVIVVGPELKLHQCGLPKQMALELFKPFVMKRLVDLGFAHNIKGAKRMIERAVPLVWDVLEKVIYEHPVLLNRAPTLHRLGIQAFEPILIEGKAIQIHPLVCTAFNADFDGDQMAVHLPLSVEAQAEARVLMLSTNNILSPAHGRPIAIPTQDMVLGCFYLTVSPEDIDKIPEKELKHFANQDEVILALDFNKVGLREPIVVRMNGEMLKTTPGRIIFNRVLPEEFPYQNRRLGKKEVEGIIVDIVRDHESDVVSETLDRIKEIGFHYATRAGVTIGIEDIEVPPDKGEIVKEAQEEIKKVEEYYRKGNLTEEEAHSRTVDVWHEATDKVGAAMEKNFDKFNPIFMMANSGARGDLKQIKQLAGMKGLVENPKGEIIGVPIISNFRDGLTVLEYFISTHGARKGLADTALRTADSGYLTRRLVDVAQDVIVREEDCGTKDSIPVDLKVGDMVNPSLIGRHVSEVIKDKKGKKIVGKDGLVSEEHIPKLEKLSQKKVPARSVLTCRAKYGVCCKCYGRNLATGEEVSIGEAVGIIAAQSIGEPGTQLTMRTFHFGGVYVGAGRDITHGLPRVVELFEARKPKGQAYLAESRGVVKIKRGIKQNTITLMGEDEEGKEKVYTYEIPSALKLLVKNNESLQAGAFITEGSADPKELLRIRGREAVQMHLVKEVQKVYNEQGVDIHDKHIEVIVRQMLKRVTINDPGDSDFLPGQLVEFMEYEKTAEKVRKEKGKSPTFKQVLLGITKASLATGSFLSAASFQETTRVLTDAAISGKVDPLLGLKENVIIGKLIPAGTGMGRYRNIRVKAIGAEWEPHYEDEGEEIGSAGEGKEKVASIREVDTGS